MSVPVLSLRELEKDRARLAELRSYYLNADGLGATGTKFVEVIESHIELIERAKEQTNQLYRALEELADVKGKLERIQTCR